MRLYLLLILVLIVPAFHAAAQNYTLNDDLLYRINFGSAEDVKVLLSKGANPNARTRQGETALNVAMERNDAESGPMAEALVAGGADIETPDKDGTPPIITAIKYKLTGVVTLMIDKGVNYHNAAPDNMTLVEYARKHGTPQMADYIQKLLDKEQASAAALRTPERFHTIVREYVMDSCNYQYWSYVLASRQLPEKEAEIKKKVDDGRARLFQLISQIQQYYTPASTAAMVKIANESVKQIYDALDVMISNSNRTEHGVGHEEDAKERCGKIISNLPIDIMPIGINNSEPPPPAIPSPKSGKPANAPQLPMDPSGGLNLTPGLPSQGAR